MLRSHVSQYSQGFDKIVSYSQNVKTDSGLRVDKVGIHVENILIDVENSSCGYNLNSEISALLLEDPLISEFRALEENASHHDLII